METKYLNIVDKRIKFYSHNTNLLPPKPKSSFRRLKKGIQEFHRKYVLVPADKASNNIDVVCRLHYMYINTFRFSDFQSKSELLMTEKVLPFTDEVIVVLVHKCSQQLQLLVLHLEMLGYILRLLR